MLVYCKDNLTKVNIQKLKLEEEDEKTAEEVVEAEAGSYSNLIQLKIQLIVFLNQTNQKLFEITRKF